MKFRSLKHLPMRLSEIGLGCASYWAKKVFSEQKAIAIVHRAVDAGINCFDTGSSYAAGHAEARLGRALHGLAGRHDLCISSKVGTRVGPAGRLSKDFSPRWIRQSVHNSLRALKLERLPVLFLHGPNPPDFNEDTYRVLQDLRASGLVGMVGVNSFDDGIIDQAVDCGQFQCVMTDFNVLKPERADRINALHRAGLDVFVAAALAGGLYSRSFYRPQRLQHLWYWARALVRQRPQLQQARQLGFLNQQPDWSAAQLALAFVLENAQLATALVGTTSLQHLRELTAVSGRQPPPEIVRRIHTIKAENGRR
jgi:aryl-alcohol dehydrogenase-like predicted oxidoreductase